MDDVLDKMNEDKRYRLINSAMKEFANNSFDKASTNVIVKEASISKGLLYHYFDSKQALFDYLLEFSMKTMCKAIIGHIDWEDGDLINRIQRILEIKLGILEEYPSMLDFGKVLYVTKSLEEIKKMTTELIPDIYFKIYSHNIDFSLFKENIDIKRVINMIQLFLDGFSEKILQKYKNSIVSESDLKKEMDELRIYLDMYKEAYYIGSKV